MEDSLSLETTSAVYPSGTEALVGTARRILPRIADSEQRFHVRIRQALHGLIASHEQSEDLSAPIAHIQYQLDLATAELELKKGNLKDAKALALAGYRRHGQRVEFIICLGRISAAANDYEDALVLFCHARAHGADLATIYYDVALLYQRMGKYAEADKLWNEGFPQGKITHKKFTGQGKPLRVLVITSPLSGNVRYQLFLKKHHAQITLFCADSYVGQDLALPEHDIIFSSIGDADLCAHSLLRAQQILRLSNAPILNHAAAAALTTRDKIAQRLANISGVSTAKIERFTKAELIGPHSAALLAKHGYTYPLLLRSPGFNNGLHFEMVSSADELAATADKLPSDEIFAISYLDTRATDGSVRKFRVLRIDGVLYPIHLAIAHSWKIHYHSSAMADNDIFRLEERRFLSDMKSYLGASLIAALHQVFDLLGLDYAGIDFSIDREGRLAVYEANATMAIIAPNNDERWNYRREAIEKALDAAAQMFFDRAGKQLPRAA
jgi:tetratricopeptide (TPR) repeat protein